MYTDASYPYFVDFKRWGTPSGPVGSVGGGTYNYFSESAGEFIPDANAFEAFGNYFFGMVCTYAGLNPDTTVLAAEVSSFQYGGSILDDPQDRPHVNAGIAAAQNFLDQNKAGLTPPYVLTFQDGCLQ